MKTDDLSEVREDEQLDWLTLETWLKDYIPHLEGSMQVAQFYGGHANLTYCVSFGDQQLVVRRPPKGDIAPGAHDMKREFRVLAGLAPAFDRAPTVYEFCDDTSVIGAPFIVVERRQGIVVRSDIPQPLLKHANIEQRISHALIDAMAELHAIDPESVGLSRLGRPDGFVSRQLSGWHHRWHLVQKKDSARFDEVHQQLLDQQPESITFCIVHNDLKLDNCMFDAADPDRVQSIFDWDMATLGDPLIELGTLLGYWREPNDDFNRAPTIDLDMSAFPARSSLVERYAQSGIDVSTIDWYEAFALWKHAAVLQQLFARFESGESKDQRSRDFPLFIPQLIDGAGRLLQ